MSTVAACGFIGCGGAAACGGLTVLLQRRRGRNMDEKSPSPATAPPSTAATAVAETAECDSSRHPLPAPVAPSPKAAFVLRGGGEEASQRGFSTVEAAAAAPADGASGNAAAAAARQAVDAPWCQGAPPPETAAGAEATPTPAARVPEPPPALSPPAPPRGWEARSRAGARALARGGSGGGFCVAAGGASLCLRAEHGFTCGCLSTIEQEEEAELPPLEPEEEGSPAWAESSGSEFEGMSDADECDRSGSEDEMPPLQDTSR